MKFEDWPNCPTTDCHNKVCLWAQTNKCYECSQAEFGSQYMDTMYLLTHDANGHLFSFVDGITISDEAYENYLKNFPLDDPRD